MGTMSGPWRGPPPRRQNLPNRARRRSPAISLRPNDGPRGFRTSTPSFMRPAISAPGWARSIRGCSTCCCLRSPRSPKSRALYRRLLAVRRDRRGCRHGTDAVCPLPAFAWMVPHLQRILAAPEIDGMVIHPAMVYEPDGGVYLSICAGCVRTRGDPGGRE